MGVTFLTSEDVYILNANYDGVNFVMDDFKWSELKEHIEKNHFVLCRVNHGDQIHLLHFATTHTYDSGHPDEFEEYAVFTTIDNFNYCHTIIIYNDGRYQYSYDAIVNNENAATQYVIEAFLHDDGTVNMPSFNKEKLLNAIEQNQTIVCKLIEDGEESYLPLTNSHIDQGVNYVFSTVIQGFYIEVLVLSDGSFHYTNESLVDNLGNIVAALDHIISLQEELIGV